MIDDPDPVVIPIDARFRLIDCGHSFHFEQLAQDALGQDKWDPAVLLRAGSYSLPAPLMLAIVRILASQRSIDAAPPGRRPGKSSGASPVRPDEGRPIIKGLAGGVR